MLIETKNFNAVILPSSMTPKEAYGHIKATYVEFSSVHRYFLVNTTEITKDNLIMELDNQPPILNPKLCKVYFLQGEGFCFFTDKRPLSPQDIFKEAQCLIEAWESDTLTKDHFTRLNKTLKGF